MRVRRKIVWVTLFAGAAFAETTLDTGIAAYNAGDYAAAKEAFGQLAQDDIVTMFWMGRVGIELKDWDSAESLLEKVVAAKPDEHEYVLWLGRAYGSHAREANMIIKGFLAPKIHKTFAKAVELKPDDLESRENLIDFFLEAPGFLGGSVEKALEQAQEIQKLDGPAGAINIARVYESQKKPADAFAVLKEASSKYPEHFGLALRAGMEAQNLGQWEEAFVIFNAMLGHNADAWGAKYQIGRAAALSATHLEEGEKALLDYLKHEPAEGEPGHEGANFRLGMIYERMNDPARAREQYEHALTIKPDYKEVQDALAKLAK
ncbi:MAG: tetratricopeptide repeat protein [Candidatus Hydrogenedentota bacterium]